MSTVLIERKTDTPTVDMSETVVGIPDRPQLVSRMVKRSNGKEHETMTAERSLPDEEGSIVYPGEVVPFALPEFVSKPEAPRFTFVALQEWEGHVVDIREDTFSARLVDVTAGGDLDTEEADFLVSDVEEMDHDLLKLGAIFRWTIGYIRHGGTKIRASQVVFRRLPQWRIQELDEARRRAEKLAAAIPWK